MIYGEVGEITDTTVFPSPRVSDRVSFGTGKAMGDWEKEKLETLYTYKLQSYLDIQTLIQQINLLYDAKTAEKQHEFLRKVPASIKAFLEENKFLEALAEMQKHSTKMETFTKRFYQWLDGFRVMKFLHFSRDNFHEQMPIASAASDLLKCLGAEVKNREDGESLLSVFRDLDSRNYQG